MKRVVTAVLLVVCALGWWPAWATDVDGPDDCQRTIRDFGDAPEGFEAYVGVLGRFPTCLNPGPIGTLNAPPVCPSITPPPGPAGFVMHQSLPAIGANYWLGCTAAGGLPLGIDSEPDGKTSPGTPTSACNPNVPVDCVEPMGALSFGQDECYGTNDAGIGAFISLTPCGPANITYRTYNCGPVHETYLNILIDWNRDGDWNDIVLCDGQCVSEWSVQNVLVPVLPGCNTQASPTFRVGPTPGFAWMRITISDTPAPPDYPWNGSAGLPNQTMANGETEDYPVRIGTPNPCEIGYEDFGDAPENVVAYPNGVVGHFPTCLAPTAAGLSEVFCAPVNLGTPPIAGAGYVRHIQTTSDPNGFWFGCNAAGTLPFWVDSETNGKVGPFGGASGCDPTVPVDCFESVEAGFTVGQDECYGDNVDAGLGAHLGFGACQLNSFTFMAHSCATNSHDVFLNVLVDWSGDGDWNDAAACGPQQVCVSEWAIKNVAIPLNPGCQVVTTPQFFSGARVGSAWMRMTMTRTPVPDDFPWNGSAGTPNGAFAGGETEDYPVDVAAGSVGVRPESADGPWLALASPNPTAAPVSMRFALTRTGRASLVAFDIAGRGVRRLVSGDMSAGIHAVRWDLRDDGGAAVSPGVYLVRLEAEGKVFMQRVIVAK